MTRVDEIFETDIIANLSKIVEADGYYNTPSVLDGYLVHYANDLLDEDNALSFPCVATQLDNDSVEQTGNNTEGRVTRTVKILGAVSVRDRTMVNRNLNSLVFDVRKALTFDKYNAQAKRATKSSAIRLGEVAYSLPNKHDQYAYFEMTITIEYTEKWI